jgi:ribosomal protein S12 methylthiotransferase accessory factor YcaO
VTRLFINEKMTRVDPPFVTRGNLGKAHVYVFSVWLRDELGRAAFAGVGAHDDRKYALELAIKDYRHSRQQRRPVK